MDGALAQLTGATQSEDFDHSLVGPLDYGGVRSQTGERGHSVYPAMRIVKLDQVTRRELKELCGIRSDTTLTKWQSMGLIPRGAIKRSPNEQGTTTYYPTEVVDLCREIKRLTGEGKDLVEVREILATQQNSKRRNLTPKSPRSSAKKSKEVQLGSRRFWITDRAVKEVKKLARYVRDTRAPRLITDELIQEAARLASEGHSPVLVIGLNESFVIANYCAGNYLEQYSEANAVLMIPLSELFAEELNHAGSLFAPVKKVEQSIVTVDEQGKRNIKRVKEIPIGDDGPGRFRRSIVLD